MFYCSVMKNIIDPQLNVYFQISVKYCVIMVTSELFTFRASTKTLFKIPLLKFVALIHIIVDSG